jgi:hypothetical protein
MMKTPKQPKTVKATTPKATKPKAAAAPAPVFAAAPAAQKPAPVAAKPAPITPAPAPVAAKPSPALPVEAPKQASANGTVSLEFVKPGASSVYVAGTFNSWQPNVTPLKPLSGGRWIGSLDVKPGKYEYLFVVDGEWLPDPNARETVKNPFGGVNSVLTV